MPRTPRNARAAMLFWLLLPSSTTTLAFTPALLLRHSLVCLGTGRTSHTMKDHRPTTTGLAVSNMGWDNEDFLEALNKGPEAVEKANAQYERLKQFGQNGSTTEGDSKIIDLNEVDDPVAAALAAGSDEEEEDSDATATGDGEGPILTEEQIEKVKQRNQEETNEGGQMFKKLLERAESGPKKDIPATPASAADSSPAAPTADLPPGFEQLSPEAQAKVFLELMNVKTGGASDAPAPLPPKPAKELRGGLGADGRKIGRNRDADAIVNSADVYFAQLKLDSSVRNMARYAGDQEKADSVFADPRIQDIQMHVNPHLDEQRKAEQAQLETGRDEMILPEMFAPSPKVDPKAKGISYKDKLAQKQRKRLAPPAPGTPAATADATVAVPTPPSGTVAQPPPVQEEETPAPVQEEANEPAPVEAEKPAPVVAEVTTPTPAVEQPKAPPSAAAVEPPTRPAPTDTRGEIRTLMGLLLKHRGGPGFGSGRIRGAEREQFESLTDSVLAKLKSEAIPDPPKTSPAVAASPSAAATAVATPTLSSASTSSAGATPSGDRVNSAITCIQGAIQMFQSSPLELQGGMLVALHAAVAAAASTLADIVQADDPPQSTASSSAPPTAERINGAIACVQGAIQMYQSSPVPEAQAGMLLALHAAVAAAASTLGDMVNTGQGTTPIITSSSEGEDEIVDSPAATTTSSPPPPVQSSAPPSGTDENTVFLEGVYEKLKRAAGPGKMGLRDDFQDAESLLEDLNKMRMLLVEELDTGIPESEGASVSSDKSSEGSAPTKYQEMLAKARADKEGK